MIIYCEAIVEHLAQQANLIECIEVLGGDPKVCKDKISVEFEGDKERCDIFISLFEHFGRHNITTIS